MYLLNEKVAYYIMRGDPQKPPPRIITEDDEDGNYRSLLYLKIDFKYFYRIV